MALDWGVVTVALPSIMHDLDTSITLIGWVLTAPGLATTVALPLSGKLCEQLGRNRVFFGCVALFTVSTLLCGLAPDVYSLIVFRVFQALGSGGFMPSATGIVAREFPERRSQMIGLFASIFPIGGVIGPNLGGFIVEHFSWREIFLVSVPMGLVVLVMLWRLPRPVEPVRARHIDFAGTAWFSVSIVALLLALSFVGQDVAFVASPLFAVLVAISAVTAAGFVWQERRAAEPLMDVALVTRNPFLVVNIYQFMFGGCVFGFFSFVPYFALLQYGLGPIEAGLAMTPRSILMMLFSIVTSLFLLKYGYRLPMLLGLWFIASTLFFLGTGATGLELGPISVGAFWLLALQLCLSGIGMGLAMPATNNAALDLAPERAAMITGIRGMFRNLGGVIGTALMVVTLELAPDKAEGLRQTFIVLSVMLALTALLTLLIPDTARDRRRSGPLGHGVPSGSPKPAVR